MLKLNIEEIKSDAPSKINIKPLGDKLDTSVPVSASSRNINFGPGVDMLFGGKSPSKKKSMDAISINDSINNDILGDNSSFKKDMDFGSMNKVKFDKKPTIIGNKKPLSVNSFPEVTSSFEKGAIKASDKDTIKIGIASANDAANKKKSDEKWKEVKKFNNIPIDPDMNVSKKPVLSAEQELREKFKYLRKLESLSKKGHKLTKQYDMKCNLEEMKGEYEMIKHDMEKKNSIKFQGKMLMTFISGIEMLNGKFDPLDINLDGWGESVSEDIENYDDVFGELHEKYGSKAKMAPEIKLLFMLGGSAAMIHMQNTMFKTAMPGMDDIMKQNPELMHQFTQAAVNTMSNDNPGVAKYMSGVMNQGTSRIRDPMEDAANMRSSPPPPRTRPATHSRGDINDFPLPRYEERSPPAKRKEMKGPSDIGDLLSNLKTKTIKLKGDSKSIMSVEDLDERDKDLTKKSKKKSKSKSKNVFNLDFN